MSCIVASVESLSTLSIVLTRPDIFGDGWVGGGWMDEWMDGWMERETDY